MWTLAPAFSSYATLSRGGLLCRGDLGVTLAEAQHLHAGLRLHESGQFGQVLMRAAGDAQLEQAAADLQRRHRARRGPATQVQGVAQRQDVVVGLVGDRRLQRLESGHVDGHLAFRRVVHAEVHGAAVVEAHVDERTLGEGGEVHAVQVVGTHVWAPLSRCLTRVRDVIVSYYITYIFLCNYSRIGYCLTHQYRFSLDRYLIS